MSDEGAAWRQRFLAPFVSFPQWSAAAQDRLFFVSDDDGSVQLWTMDLASGERRRLTDQAVGVEELVVLPDGSGVAWWQDATGSQNGRWVVTPASGGDPKPLLPDVPEGWGQGLALARDVVAAAFADDASGATVYRLLVSCGGEPPRLLREATFPLGIGREWETTGGGLSTDGVLLCYRHADRGDMLHFGLRVVRTADGQVVGELVDDGLTVKVAEWAPAAGDQRLALVHERDGVERPAVWDLTSGDRRDYPLDLPGPVDVAGWWPDGSALLLLHDHDGRRTLHRLDVATGAVELVHNPHGWVSGAGVRPNGAVWLRDEAADRPPQVRAIDGRVVLAPLGEPPLPGRPHRSLRFSGPSGEPTHMLLTLPEGQAPHPVVMMVHGGPEWAYPDELDAWEQALVDHGYAVAKVNYRGSTGSTVAWRTTLHGGNIGFPEVADVVAGLDHLVGEGVADASRAVIEGWSWGGYVTLLSLGLHPDRFAAAIAGIPVADSVMAHEDCSPPMQAYDDAIMGGSPAELPEVYAERSPITYIDQVRAPVLLIAGEHDSACPIRQVRHYVEGLRSRGRHVELHVYEAGHHANTAAEKLLHAELELDFLRRNLA